MHVASSDSVKSFNLVQPDKQATAFVVNSPHSGRNYPAEFLTQSRLNAHKIRSSEDFLVDELVQHAPDHGIPVLRAEFPRAFIDVNREPYELDQSMFDRELPTYANTKSLRVSSGLGTIAKIVAEGEEIYSQKLRVEDALERIETFYKPYHAALRNLLARTHVKFGCAVLLDCHSMPSASAIRTDETRPDFILGDRFGKSCTPALTHYARSILQNMGYHVELNKPYAGGFITEHYGRPESGLHALQIEINRGLYMNETKLQANAGFAELAENLTWFIAQLSSIEMEELLGTVPLAAE